MRKLSHHSLFKFGSPCLLCSNAISGLVKGVARAPDIDEKDMETMFATNVTGLINMTQAVLPIFKARPDGGSGDIIQLGSIAGRESYPGGSIYCATKAAVRAFTESLRRELIETKIRVMEIDPGQVETVCLPHHSTFTQFCAYHVYRNSLSFDSVVTRPRPMPSMRKFIMSHLKMSISRSNANIRSGVEPLTPEDIAEVIVFTATRRQNVVIADTLIYHNHQVSPAFFSSLYVIITDKIGFRYWCSPQGSLMI